MFAFFLRSTCDLRFICFYLCLVPCKKLSSCNMYRLSTKLCPGRSIIGIRDILISSDCGVLVCVGGREQGVWRTPFGEGGGRPAVLKAFQLGPHVHFPLPRAPPQPGRARRLAPLTCGLRELSASSKVVRQRRTWLPFCEAVAMALMKTDRGTWRTWLGRGFSHMESTRPIWCEATHHTCHAHHISKVVTSGSIHKCGLVTDVKKK